MNNFGIRLAECRRNKNFTQEELANRLGVTPQALSKWEKGLSSPDISMLCSLCGVLDVSADFLLGTGNGKFAEDEDVNGWQKSWKSLRNCLEQLKIIFGMEIMPAFVEALEGDRYIEKVSQLRQRLAKEGTVLPIVRMMDQECIKPKEFYILAFENVLYREEVEQVDETTFDYILEKLEETVRTKYAEILDADTVKCLTDNLKMQYPALITGIVPEKISYGRLLDICKVFLNRGNSLMYLPKIIEEAERALREKPDCSIKELAETVCSSIERPDNFWVMLANIKCS